MKSNFISTWVTGVLEQHDIAFKVLPHERPATTILDAAEQRGVNPDQMVKSMLLRDMGGLYVLACVPGTASVDPGKVRALFGCRRMTCVDSGDVRKVTGFAPGMVTPVALATEMPVVFDQSLTAHTRVNISSGDPLAGLELALSDLIGICSPTLSDICR